MKIYCCDCERDIDARLTDGKEIYPHRRDLYRLPFWVCDKCGNYVGCHHKTKDRTRPLGCIPTPAIKQARQEIHSIMDPLWKSGRVDRRVIYSQLSMTVGRKYHTAEIRSMDEALLVLRVVKSLASKKNESAPAIDGDESN